MADCNLGVRLFSVQILINADAENQAQADQVAELISALGPEDVPQIPAVAPTAEQHTTEQAATPTRQRNFRIGDRVWCNVHGAEGWTTVTEVGTGRNRGRIKIIGERMWCPATNFDREPS